MPIKRVEVKFDRAPDDPRANNDAFLTEVRGLSASLSKNKVDYQQVAMAMDSAVGEGFPLAEYFIALGPASIAAVAALGGAWVHAKLGRKVRVKIGEVEAEGRTVAEVRTLLMMAAAFDKRESLVGDAQELEVYRGFSIRVTLAETPTTWRYVVVIGSEEGDQFTHAFPTLDREFAKSDGALNCGVAMLAMAREAIDERQNRLD